MSQLSQWSQSPQRQLRTNRRPSLLQSLGTIIDSSDQTLIKRYLRKANNDVARAANAYFDDMKLTPPSDAPSTSSTVQIPTPSTPPAVPMSDQMEEEPTERKTPAITCLSRFVRPLRKCKSKCGESYCYPCQWRGYEEEHYIGHPDWADWDSEYDWELLDWEHWGSVVEDREQDYKCFLGLVKNVRSAPEGTPCVDEGRRTHSIWDVEWKADYNFPLSHPLSEEINRIFGHLPAHIIREKYLPKQRPHWYNIYIASEDLQKALASNLTYDVVTNKWVEGPAEEWMSQWREQARDFFIVYLFWVVRVEHARAVREGSYRLPQRTTSDQKLDVSRLLDMANLILQLTDLYDLQCNELKQMDVLGAMKHVSNASDPCSLLSLRYSIRRVRRRAYRVAILCHFARQEQQQYRRLVRVAVLEWRRLGGFAPSKFVAAYGNDVWNHLANMDRLELLKSWKEFASYTVHVKRKMQEGVVWNRRGPAYYTPFKQRPPFGSHYGPESREGRAGCRCARCREKWSEEWATEVRRCERAYDYNYDTSDSDSAYSSSC